MTYPAFNSGDILTASDMNAVGLWRVTNCTVTSSGGTAATASNGVITVGNGNTSVTVIGAFSATYENYLIQYSNGGMTNDTAIACQIGGATSGHYGSYVYGQYSTTAVLGANDNNAAQFSYIGGGDPFSGAGANFTLLNPFLAKQTYIHAGPVAYTANVGTYVGRLATATSYADFRLFPVAGSFTGGTIRIYGYNK